MTRESASELVALRLDLDGIEATSQSPDGVLLAVAVGKHIHIYHTETFELVEVLTCFHTVRWLEFAPCLEFGREGYQLLSHNANVEKETPSFIFCWSLSAIGEQTNSREIFTTCPDVNVSFKERKVAGPALFGGSALSNDGRTLLSMIGHPGADEHIQHCIIAFDLFRWAFKFHIETDLYMVYCVFSPDDSLIATTSLDGSLRLYDNITGSLSKCLGPIGGEKWIATFSPDSRLIAVTAFDGKTGTILIWNLDEHLDRVPVILGGFTSEPRTMAWSPNGLSIAAGSWLGKLIVFDTKTWTVKQIWQPGLTSMSTCFPRSLQPQIEVDSIQWLEGSDKLAFRCGGALVVYDVQSNIKWAWASEFSGGLRSFVYLERKEWIGAVGEDGDMRFWKLSPRPMDQLIKNNQSVETDDLIGLNAANQLIEDDEWIEGEDLIDLAEPAEQPTNQSMDQPAVQVILPNEEFTRRKDLVTLDIDNQPEWW